MIQAENFVVQADNFVIFSNTIKQTMYRLFDRLYNHSNRAIVMVSIVIL